MNERENARRPWTRVLRSLAIAGFIASFAVGCASDARNADKLATDSETHPITSVSPSAIAATQEKEGSEGEVAVGELAPRTRALGPAGPSGGPAVVINESGTVTTTTNPAGLQPTTGGLVVGEDAGAVVAPSAVVAPAAADVPVAAGAATTMAAAATSAPVPGAAMLAGETGPAVVPPAAIPVVPTGVATGVTSISVAGAPLPTTVGGATVPSVSVAGPAVVAPSTTAIVTNNPTNTVIRVEPAATATTASGVVSTTTSSPASAAADGGTTVLGVRATRPAEESRIGISNRDGATAPAVIETPQRRSVLPWRNRAAVSRVLNTWSPSSQMAARTAIPVYGQPDLLTDRRMVWNNRAPWTRIEVMRDPVAQVEPGVDSGMIVHTIIYPVSAGQAQELRRFNRNIHIDAASGELSVRGVSEAANLLALNLIDEIVRGTRDAEGALQFYRDALRDGVITAYEQRLMFTPRTRAARR